MAKPYSQDLRERVIRAIDDGHARNAVARLFNLGIATVGRYVKRQRQTGSLKPDKFGGHQPYKLAAHEQKVSELVSAAPDQTLRELRDQLAVAGIEASKSALDRFLRATGLTYKKKPSRQPNKNAQTWPKRAPRGVKHKKV